MTQQHRTYLTIALEIPLITYTLRFTFVIHQTSTATIILTWPASTPGSSIQTEQKTGNCTFTAVNCTPELLHLPFHFSFVFIFFFSLSNPHRSLYYLVLLSLFVSPSWFLLLLFITVLGQIVCCNCIWPGLFIRRLPQAQSILVLKIVLAIMLLYLDGDQSFDALLCNPDIRLYWRERVLWIMFKTTERDFISFKIHICYSIQLL